MFTGLVADSRDVVARRAGDDGRRRLEIDAPLAARARAGRLGRGQRRLPDGARDRAATRFRADVVCRDAAAHDARRADGRVARSTWSSPLRASDRLGGHFVLGHVDGVGEVRALHESGEIEVAIDRGARALRRREGLDRARRRQPDGGGARRRRR